MSHIDNNIETIFAADAYNLWGGSQYCPKFDVTVGGSMEIPIVAGSSVEAVLIVGYYLQNNHFYRL